MSKIYSSKDQMIEDMNQTRKETNKEFNVESKEVKNSKLSTIIFAIVLIILFKLIVGTLDIPNPMPYGRGMFYEVTLNGRMTELEVKNIHKFPIIPFFANIVSYSSNLFGWDFDSLVFDSSTEKIIIDINAYTCHSKNFNNRMSCNSVYEEGVTTKEVSDIEYTHLIVRKGYKEVYSGKYKSDISEYITGKGHYDINISAKYKNLYNEIFIMFDIK